MREAPKHRSVSQLKQYEQCPYAYYLTRIEGVWQRPAAWLPQGSAVHEAAEYWERSGRTASVEETQEVFAESYAEHVNRMCETTPNMDWWFNSGPYDGRRDIERRFQIGKEQVVKYIEWYTNHPEQAIWIAPDGTPGIELEFDIELGGVQIKGAIDAIIEQGSRVIVRDNKTGNSAGDVLQLEVYSIAIAEQYGIDRPELGDFWMGKSGKVTFPFDLTETSVEEITERFMELEENIKAGRFPKKPDPERARFCPVVNCCSRT